MSREEVAAFLRNLQLSLDGLQRELEARICGLPETKHADLAQLLAGCRAKVSKFGADALREFDEFAEESGLQLPQEDSAADAAATSPGMIAAAGGDGQGFERTPYSGVQLRSLEKRVASMGGIPALGACVLPKMTPGLRPALNTTASPAAVEIMRGRLGGSDADALSHLRHIGGEEEAAHTPLVKLRAAPTPESASGQRPAAVGSAPPNSELAAAIARRMQRLGSASPEKNAGGAAVAGEVQAG